MFTHVPRYLDIGVYGVPKKLDTFHNRNTTRAIEEFVRSTKG